MLITADKNGGQQACLPRLLAGMGRNSIVVCRVEVTYSRTWFPTPHTAPSCSPPKVSAKGSSPRFIQAGQRGRAWPACLSTRASARWARGKGGREGRVGWGRQKAEGRER